MNVTISPLGIPKLFRPLISFPIDLSIVLNEYMYISYSASTGLLAADHNVHAWMELQDWGKGSRLGSSSATISIDKILQEDSASKGTHLRCHFS